MSEHQSPAETATERVRAIDEWLDGIEDAEDVDQERVRAVLEYVEALQTVLAELEDVLASTDFSELPEAIDARAVLEAVDVGELPDAIRNHDAAEVVELRELLEAINYRELWDVGNVREIWSETGELTDAVGALVGGEDEATGGGLLGGDEGEKAGDDEAGEKAGDDEAGMLEGAAEEGEAALESGFELAEGDAEAYQFLIQQQALEGLDGLRDALLIAHEKFEQLYEYNRKRSRQIDRETNSRNPTAVSTITTERPDLRDNARYSTIPRQVQHSSAPGHTRIYGDRFERERRRRRGETNE